MNGNACFVIMICYYCFMNDSVPIDEHPPELRPILGSQMFADVYEYAKNLKNDVLLDHGEPPDLINNELAQMSGISRFILHSRLNEIRQKDINYLAKFETELADLIMLISNLDYTNGTQIPSLNFSIQYADIKILNEPKDEKLLDKELLNEGAISIKDYYKKWGSGFKQDIDEKELIELIKSRKETLKLLGINEVETPNQNQEIKTEDNLDTNIGETL